MEAYNQNNGVTIIENKTMKLFEFKLCKERW
jgi:hypothetical protein